MAEQRPSDDGTADLPDTIARLQETDEVTKALLARPQLSLRTQVILGFLVVFLLSLALAAAIIYSTYRVEGKIKFLEIVNDYVFEIDRARRHEKNYFLYSTNLKDALDSVYKAKQILENNIEELTRIIGRKQWEVITKNIDGYEGMLEMLASQRGKGPDGGPIDKAHELAVRKQGQRMILLAQDLMKKERRAVESSLANSRRIQSYSLVILLFFMITTAYLISGNIVRSIVRFESYAQRIAAGDFTPITPTRRYRDEFTNLGLAINYMMLELQKHESMLVQAHKMRAIGTLTAGVAHELNNPLNNISLTAHMMLEDYTDLDDDERRDMMVDVVKEAERAKQIVSNLLDFTRESETKLEPLDLVRLVRETIALAANQIKIAGIKVELAAMDDPPRILGDRQQLRQVFLNLILNAVEASDRGGKMQVLVHPSDEPDHLSVKVIDYGSGIPAKILPRIFEPFFTTKETGKGTGLGLSVSEGIIAKHSGHVKVDSREGKGTTFTVILPVTTLS
jgi:signal transduction histidine kinase